MSSEYNTQKYKQWLLKFDDYFHNDWYIAMRARNYFYNEGLEESVRRWNTEKNPMIPREIINDDHLQELLIYFYVTTTKWYTNEKERKISLAYHIDCIERQKKYYIKHSLGPLPKTDALIAAFQSEM